jgi:proteic killer suppression protein
MILSFKHRGLERFYRNGSKAGIQPDHAARIERLLSTLNQARRVENMNVPGWDLHPLKGKLEGHWSVKVNGNWRITFRFSNGDAEVVDYQDYH